MLDNLFDTKVLLLGREGRERANDQLDIESLLFLQHLIDFLQPPHRQLGNDEEDAGPPFFPDLPEPSALRFPDRKPIPVPDKDEITVTCRERACNDIFNLSQNVG